MSDLPDPAQEIRDLRDENDRLRKWLRIIAHELASARNRRNAAQKALDGEQPSTIQSTGALNETTTDPK